MSNVLLFVCFPLVFLLGTDTNEKSALQPDFEVFEMSKRLLPNAYFPKSVGGRVLTNVRTLYV